MKEYNDVFETVKTILKDREINKAGAESIKFSTGYNAVSFCREFKEWAEYDNLFDRLKNDLKKEGIKFAGTPLHKACLVVATAVIDCKIEVAGSDDQAFESFKELLKANSLTFSSKQSAVRVALGAANDEDIDAVGEQIIKKLDSAIKTISELSEFLDNSRQEQIIKLLESVAEKRKKTA